MSSCIGGSISLASPKTFRISADYVKNRRDSIKKEVSKRESKRDSIDDSLTLEEETSSLFHSLPSSLQKYLTLCSAEKRRSLWTGNQQQSITHERAINTISLKEIFQNYCGVLPVFEEFCSKCSATENIEFLRESSLLARLIERGGLTQDVIVNKQKELYKKFIDRDSDMAINIDYEELASIDEKINDAKPDIYLDAQKIVVMLLETDCVRKFICDPLFDTWKAEEIKRRIKASAKKEIPPWVAFTQAVKHDSSLEILDALIEQGASAMDEDELTAQTALHFACAKQTKSALEIVQYLLSNAADANAHDHQAWTPLHVACSSGTFEIIRYLLARGANPCAATKDGDLPLHYFAKGSILSSMDQMDDFVSILDRLLFDEKVINAKNCAGETALHYSVYNENKETRTQVIKLLLKKGSNVNAKSKRGTALHIAIIQNKSDIVELLLQNGADVSILCESKRGQKSSEQLARECCNEEILKLITTTN